MIKKSASLIGEIRNNNFGTEMKIIAYRKHSDIDVQFMDDYGYVVHNTTYTNFRKEQIKNPYDPTTYNIGYLGVGNHMAKSEGKVVDSYNTWHDMIRRCYSEKSKSKFSAYYHICTVSKLWHNYQNFAEWFDKNKYFVEGRLHIDKDILYSGNKMYNPETCLLVPQRINMLFVNIPNSYGLPNGIRPTSSNRYSAMYNGKSLGVYDTLEDAYSIYSHEKEKVIQQIANEYKEIIPLKLYDALMEYRVRIDIDKNWVA